MDYTKLYGYVIDSIILNKDKIIFNFLNAYNASFEIFYYYNNELFQGEFSLKSLYDIDVKYYEIFNVFLIKTGIIIETFKIINGIKHTFSIPLVLDTTNINNINDINKCSVMFNLKN